MSMKTTNEKFLTFAQSLAKSTNLTKTDEKANVVIDPTHRISGKFAFIRSHNLKVVQEKVADEFNKLNTVTDEKVLLINKSKGEKSAEDLKYLKEFSAG